MGRRLNISTPTVINTELVPLDDSFYIEANGQTEQWYYDNTNQFAPNRITTPLTLTPKISAFDQDTQTSYVPSFQSIGWYEQAWDETQQDYVETLITNHVDSSSAEYVISNNNLIVKKNVPYTHAITIRCAAVYTDPRDAGVRCTVETTVVLLTNRDAEVISPTLDILCPPSIAFNPLKDYSSNVATRSKTMKAIASWTGIIPTELLSCKVDPLGTEELIPNNIENLVTCTPYLDIRYGATEQQDQQFFYRQTSGGLVNPIDGNTSYVSKIKGNTVSWNQLLKNSDFSQGVQEWTANSVNTITIENGWLAITATAENTNCYLRQMMNVIEGHKYFVSTLLRPSTNTQNTAITFQNVTALSVSLSQDTETKVKNITTGVANAIDMRIYIDRSVARPVGTKLYVKYFSCIDLTLIFGAGSEPTTVADFESWLDANIGLKDYYPYNEGELIPVRMTGIKTVGFNLWDGEWSSEENRYLAETGEIVPTIGILRVSSFIKVLPSSTIYLYGIGGNFASCCFYDINKNFIIGYRNYNLGKKTLNVPQNAYYLRASFNYTSQPIVNLSDASRNGTYEPHWEDTSVFDVTTVKGKLNGQGQDVYIFPDGMKRVGDIYDSIYVENGVVKARKKIGGVDMGSLTWGTSTGIDYANLSSALSGANFVTTYAGVSSLLCGKYINGSAQDTYNGNSNIFGRSGAVYVKDANYSTGDAFAAAMNGVYLYYELATYQDYVIDPSTLPRGFFEWYGVENGVEVKADTLPWYVSGQNTDTLTIDPMYGEKIAVVLRAKKNQSDTSLYPAKAYRNVVWRVPNIDTHVVCANGGAVRSDTQRMDFSSISNANGEVLDDNTKLEQLAFKWVSRRNNESVENNQGWGHEKSITASDLRNTIGAGQSSLASTMVFPYVYLKGAFEKITDNSELVTDGGETVYDRPVE